MAKMYTLKALRPLIPMARQKPPLQVILDPLDDGTGLWIVRYVADEHGFWLQVNDEYAGAEVPGQTLSRQGIFDLTGFDVDDLETKKIDGVKGYFYAKQGGVPLLPLQFTAKQFREFDKRAYGIFSIAMGKGGLSPKDLTDKLNIGPPPRDSAVWSPEVWRDFTKEWLTELEKTNPDAAELGQAILFGIELEEELVSDSVDDARNAKDTVHSIGLVINDVPSMPDAQRRLARLRSAGGGTKLVNGSWKFKGSTKLARLERSEGRERSDEQTVRADLVEACEAEQKAKREGAIGNIFASLTQQR